MKQKWTNEKRNCQFPRIIKLLSSNVTKYKYVLLGGAFACNKPYASNNNMYVNAIPRLIENTH